MYCHSLKKPWFIRAGEFTFRGMLLVFWGLLGCSGSTENHHAERPTAQAQPNRASSESPASLNGSAAENTSSGSASKNSGSGSRTNLQSNKPHGSNSRVTDAPQAAAAADDALAEYVSNRTADKLAEQADTLDPSKDGWNSEALSSATNAGYKQLAKWLAGSGVPATEKLATFVTDDFTCLPLRPAKLETAYSAGAIEVRRGVIDTNRAVPFAGAAGLADAIAELLAPLEQASHPHIKFKQFKIRPGEAEIGTTAYFHAFAETPTGPVEINATWDCNWRVAEGDRLLLASIAVRDYEQAQARIQTPTLFSDLTATVMGANSIFREQLLRDVPHWRKTLPANMNVQYHGHFGLAVGDVNGDDLEDVYLCQPGGLPNRLFLQQPDGTVRESAAEAGLDILNYTRGALLVDLDNDGDQDLVLTVVDQVTIFSNDGTGAFEVRAEFPQIRGAYSISAADFDNDTDLDLYVCRHRGDGHDKGEFPVPYPYYDANNGGENYFLRNEGDWKFTEATAELGLDVDNTRFSFASSWEDYDNDGDLDLYVANDFGRNTLYRNEGGKFISASDLSGLDDMAFGMSVSWGDYNRDGHMDLYVGNMFSAAGNRITFQDQFRPDLSEQELAKYQRTARGNSLFVNRGDGTFEDVSTQSAITQGRWSWASLFADINNDGWEDLLVTNGFVTGDTIDDL